MIKSRAKQVALIAIMAATIEAGKLALMALPNIEIVSILCAVYGYVFGWLGIFSTYIFVAIELIHGFNTWVISYIIYWPLIAIVFYTLKRCNLKSKWIATLAISILTIFFGVLTSAVDTGLFLGTITWEKFSIMYARGIVFYLLQLSCNIVLFLFAYSPLVNLLENRIKPKFIDSVTKKKDPLFLEQNNDINKDKSL